MRGLFGSTIGPGDLEEPFFRAWLSDLVRYQGVLRCRDRPKLKRERRKQRPVLIIHDEACPVEPVLEGSAFWAMVGSEMNTRQVASAEDRFMGLSP